MTLPDLCTTETLDAAGQQMYAACRLRGGDVFMTPWGALHAETRALLRMMACSAITAAWAEAERAVSKPMETNA